MPSPNGLNNVAVWIAHHGRLFVDVRLLPACVLEGRDLGVQRGRRLLKPLVVGAPKDGCVARGATTAVKDERGADRDTAFLIALARLGERRRESELVEVVQCGGHDGSGTRSPFRE